jgi:hypothetical protein
MLKRSDASYLNFADLLIANKLDGVDLGWVSLSCTKLFKLN